MKNKKNLFVYSSAIFLCVAIVGTVLTNRIVFNASADTVSYSIKMENGKNEFHNYTDTNPHSGEDAIIKTELGNNIKFKYANLYGDTDSWHVLDTNDSYFQNIDPIHGMKSIFMYFKTNSANFKIYWSNNSNFNEYKSETLTSPSSSLTRLDFDFDNNLPNYFKIENTSGDKLSISSMDISYDCIDSYSTLTVTSIDPTMGSVSGDSGMIRVGREVSITANPSSGYTFEGWYNNNSCVSMSNPYTFTMPEYDYSLTAKFSFNQEDWNKRHGVIPVIDEVNKIATYGLYPQNEVTDASLLSVLNEFEDSDADVRNGWYYYNYDYYAKIGNSEKTRWFLCEAIQWKILESNTSGEYLLIPSVLLDAHCLYTSIEEIRTINYVQVHPNNYKYSDVRAWLNGYDGSLYSVANYSNKGFFNTAFGLNPNYIETTEVDNSAATTTTYTDGTNPFVCKNTQDKVLLPSYQQCIKYFPDDVDRRCVVTEYAAANGGKRNTNPDFLNCGSYWSRSPDHELDDNTWEVYDYYYESGSLTRSYVNDASNCVRPLITININN